MSPATKDKKQSGAFIEAARKAGVDEDEKRWEARLKAVAKPPEKPTKKGRKLPWQAA